MEDFISLIKSHAKNDPNRVAIIDRKRTISYGDFFNLVIAISNKLMGLKKAPRIALDLDQSIESYAIIVAVMNVGGAYCPFNKEAPIERKRQIIEEFKPDLIIVESEEKIKELGLPQAIEFKSLTSDNNYNEINIVYNPEDTIYVIYTSGSTGVPKGVMISRKSLQKFLEWAIPAYGAGKNDIWGQFSSLSFDLSIVDIFTCLCSGATLYAMNDQAAKKNRPAGEIETRKITIWHSVPSAVEFMIVNEKTKRYNFSSLRLMSFCGEPLKKHQVAFLFEKKRDLFIFNTYGPTEGTLFFTCQQLKNSDYLDYTGHTVSIGKPIPGWNLDLVEAEESEEKEIIIYGDYIGKGYIRDNIDSKFKSITINNKLERAFETGDLITEINGNLFFSRRKDRQIKIKGFRIELDEIDFRIRELIALPSVTIAKGDTLYSFIETENKIDEAALREYLKSTLEPYKIPNTFHTISQIPRNHNLKVDNVALIQLIS